VAFGSHIADNRLADNGFFGNPTNGDLADGTIAFGARSLPAGQRVPAAEARRPPALPARPADHA
jgi:hypothetical protein